ncbi:hypothetical protein BZG36_02078 [Bifiguratus adelaidae]|uniref:Ribosomal RNA-processing protein 14/surfeit locus protein 6 C-terminal domain-containing protein n=1 Tax=Bifiguratus adelaidae TaxID=1938954 RepID=A0A261Y350_9FUNG|nr:hypothetical protein BZG36_02078 [Bifiguratus adelaidae]
MLGPRAPPGWRDVALARGKQPEPRSDMASNDEQAEPTFLLKSERSIVSPELIPDVDKDEATVPFVPPLPPVQQQNDPKPLRSQGTDMRWSEKELRGPRPMKGTHLGLASPVQLKYAKESPLRGANASHHPYGYVEVSNASATREHSHLEARAQKPPQLPPESIKKGSHGHHESSSQVDDHIPTFILEEIETSSVVKPIVTPYRPHVPKASENSQKQTQVSQLTSVNSASSANSSPPMPIPSQHQKDTGHEVVTGTSANDTPIFRIEASSDPEQVKSEENKPVSNDKADNQKDVAQAWEIGDNKLIYTQKNMSGPIVRRSSEPTSSGPEFHHTKGAHSLDAGQLYGPPAYLNAFPPRSLRLSLRSSPSYRRSKEQQLEDSFGEPLNMDKILRSDLQRKNSYVSLVASPREKVDTTPMEEEVSQEAYFEGLHAFTEDNDGELAPTPHLEVLDYREEPHEDCDNDTDHDASNESLDRNLASNANDSSGSAYSPNEDDMESGVLVAQFSSGAVENPNSDEELAEVTRRRSVRRLDTRTEGDEESVGLKAISTSSGSPMDESEDVVINERPAVEKIMLTEHHEPEMDNVQEKLKQAQSPEQSGNKDQPQQSLESQQASHSSIASSGNHMSQENVEEAAVQVFEPMPKHQGVGESKEIQLTTNEPELERQDMVEMGWEEGAQVDQVPADPETSQRASWTSGVKQDLLPIEELEEERTTIGMPTPDGADQDDEPRFDPHDFVVIKTPQDDHHVSPLKEVPRVAQEEQITADSAEVPPKQATEKSLEQNQASAFKLEEKGSFDTSSHAQMATGAKIGEEAESKLHRPTLHRANKGDSVDARVFAVGEDAMTKEESSGDQAKALPESRISHKHETIFDNVGVSEGQEPTTIHPDRSIPSAHIRESQERPYHTSMAPALSASHKTDNVREGGEPRVEAPGSRVGGEQFQALGPRQSEIDLQSNQQQKLSLPAEDSAEEGSPPVQQDNAGQQEKEPQLHATRSMANNPVRRHGCDAIVTSNPMRVPGQQLGNVYSMPPPTKECTPVPSTFKATSQPRFSATRHNSVHVQRNQASQIQNDTLANQAVYQPNIVQQANPPLQYQRSPSQAQYLPNSGPQSHAQRQPIEQAPRRSNTIQTLTLVHPPPPNVVYDSSPTRKRSNTSDGRHPMPRRERPPSDNEGTASPLSVRSKASISSMASARQSLPSRPAAPADPASRVPSRQPSLMRVASDRASIISYASTRPDDTTSRVRLSMIGDTFAVAQAGILHNRQALREFREKVRKTKNPDVQFAYAKYLLQIADLYVESPETGIPPIKSGKSLREEAIVAFREEALHYLNKLIRHQYAEAAFVKGLAYVENRYGIAKNVDKAFKSWMTATKMGHVEANYFIGRYYEEKGDHYKASTYYNKAASLGSLRGNYREAMIHLLGELKQHQNFKQGLNYLKRAADMADETCPEPAYVLGLVLCSQFDNVAIPRDLVMPDNQEAVRYFFKASALDYTLAQYKLGQIFEYGLLDQEIDPRLSFEQYGLAARKGHKESMLSISGWYLVGAEPEFRRDEVEAFRWCARAADMGFEKAEYALGYYYEVGIGTMPDQQRAKEYYTRAASKGYAQAVDRLKRADTITRKDYELKMSNSLRQRREKKADHEDVEGIEVRIQQYQRDLDQLLSEIPAEDYLRRLINEKSSQTHGHAQKRKNGPDVESKKVQRQQAKKAKLDPAAKNTIPELHRTLTQDETPSDDEAPVMNMNGGSFGNESDTKERETDADEENALPVHQGNGHHAQKEGGERPSISELRARLESRIAALRKARNAPGSDPSKPITRATILENRQKKKQERKEKRKLLKEKRANGQVSEELVKLNHSTSNNSAKSPASIREDGEVSFSKFEFDGRTEKKKKGPTDAKGQLKMAEAKQEKLAQLRATDEAKAKEVQEKEAWRKAAALASGEKIKDDVKLLKKSVKREEKVKQKSGKAWNERKEKVTHDIAARQKKRQENLQARMESKKSKKSGGSKKKQRPGFEGGKAKKAKKSR